MGQRWWIAGLLAACTAAGDGPAAEAPEDEGVIEPLSRADLEAQLQEGLARTTRIDGELLQRAYGDALDMGNEVCPTGGLFQSDGYWVANCDAGATSFDGYAYAIEESGIGTAGAWYIQAEATIARPNGDHFDLGGYAGWGRYADATTDWTYHYAYGTFHDTLADRSDTWLGEPSSVDFYATVGLQGSGDRYVYLDGAIGGLYGDRARAIDFVQVELGALVDPDCADGPRGEIWLRQPDGAWVQTRFDCDPCGVALLGDEELADVCIDMTAWTQEGLPW